jgi:hypothetical protein
MKNKLLFPIILTVLILTACKSPQTATPAPPQPTQAPTASNNKLDLVDQTIHEENADPKFNVNVVYPTVKGQDAFNQAITDRMNKLVSAFKDDAEKAKGVPAPEGSFSGLDAKYTAHYAREKLISIEFTVSQYMVGAAHPNPYTITFNYDPAQSKELTLDDILAAPYVDFLSRSSIEALKKTGELEWEDGAAPKPENFQNWNISDQGLVITFDPYTVGSYASGYHKVTIPFIDLKPYIRPGSPLEAVAPKM